MPNRAYRVTCRTLETANSYRSKIYSQVLERRIWSIVEPRIEEEQHGFCPGRGTLDQLFTLVTVLEGAWEFAQPVYIRFCGLEGLQL